VRNTRAQLRDSSSIKISIQSEQYVNYQEKSHSQNVATTVMGITGGASLLTGMGFTLPQFSHGFERGASDRDYTSTPEILTATGGRFALVLSFLLLQVKKNKTLQGCICKKKL